MSKWLEARAPLMVTLLIIVGVLRIASTFRVFADTADEANHIKASLEIYQFHQYEVHKINPPLPRLIFGFAPYLGGMRYDPGIVDFTKGLQFIFHGAGKYEANLVRARVGNLVFFVIGAVGVWFLARRYLDVQGALLALLLFTTQPVVLGYSGLATHDAAALAGTATALVAFARWLDKPDLRRAAVLGLAYGFAALCKFLCIAFVPAACGALLLVRLMHDAVLRRGVWRALATIAVVPPVAFLTVWAGYAFTIGAFGRFAHVPAPSFFQGLSDILQIDRQGMLCFALGRVARSGWWWYFPLTVLLKTTLAMLILFAIGAWFALRSPQYRWTYAEWALATLAIFLPVMGSSMDLGVRYVLPAYFALTIAAAAAAMAMLRGAQRPMRYTAAALLAWHLVASTIAHPDYFPYFNELAVRNPSHFLSDSNLDWGQDILRLRRFCRQRGIALLPRALFGNADLDALGFPQDEQIDWNVPPAEPTALSESRIVLSRMSKADAFPWADHEPWVRVGKSIRVYGLVTPYGRAGQTIRVPGGTRILLPLVGTVIDHGAPGGMVWRVEQSVHNSGPGAVSVWLSAYEQVPRRIDVASGSSVAIALNAPYAYVTLADHDSDRVHFATRLQRIDASGSGASVDIPAVDEREFRHGSLEIGPVWFRDPYRVSLRVWTRGDGAESAQVTLRDAAGRILATKALPLDRRGFGMLVDVVHDFGNVAQRREPVSLTVDTPGATVWAFVSAIDPNVPAPALYFPRQPG